MSLKQNPDNAEATNMPTGVRQLSGRLTIAEIEQTHGILSQAIEDCQQLTLDTSELECVDTAGIQLLIAARRSALQAGKSICLSPPPSGALLAALIAAGFRSPDNGDGRDGGHDGFWFGRS